MRKIRVVLSKQDKLVISLPESLVEGKHISGMGFSTATTKISVQNRRPYYHYHKLGFSARRNSINNNRKDAAQQISGKLGGGVSGAWDRLVGDRARMIEMHAF